MFNTFLLFLQALQKICLANHIWSLAELLHADALQQLEVALLGYPVACLIDILSAGLKSTAPTPQLQVVHPPCSFTTTPMSPLPSMVLIMGVTDIPVASRTMAASSGSEGTTPPLYDETTSLKCCWIFPTPIPQPDMTPRSFSSSCTLPLGPSTPLPTVVVPELSIPSHAQLELLHCPGGGKEYQCQLCTFWHTNKDCMLMHVHQHLEITISCPMCGKSFQIATSFRKHSKKAHAFQIIEFEDQWILLSYS